MTPAIRPALIFSALVWLAAEFVLQAHGICFWAEHGGWQGWVWSVALGVATVWFWLHRSPAVRWSFGLLASLLLLAGPLWQVGAPLIVAADASTAQRSAVVLRLETLRNAETNQVETLRAYLRNSELRPGWAPELARVQAELAQTRDALVTAAAPATSRAPWLSRAVIVIQLLALIVLQVAAVIALTAIRVALTGSWSALREISASKSGVPGNKSFEEFSDSVCAQIAAVLDLPVSLLHRQMSQPLTAPPQKRNADTTALRQRIASGQHGAAPTIRKVMEAEGRRYQVVGPIFKELVAEGVLVLDGKNYRLAGRLDA